MDYIDKKTMIHVAAELVIIIGIAFWLNSKINTKDEKIEALEKQVELLTNRLTAIESYLSGRPAQPSPVKPLPVKPSKKETLPVSEEEEIVSDDEIEI
jgi:hypothetical protein